MSLLPGTPDRVLLNELVSAVCNLSGTDVARAGEIAGCVTDAATQLEVAMKEHAEQHGAHDLVRSGLLSYLERLTGLAGELQAGLQRGGAWAEVAEIRVLAACRLALTCLDTTSEAPQVLACTQLLLGPGRTVLERHGAVAAAAGAAGSSTREGRNRLLLLSIQAELMHWLLPTFSRGLADGRAALVQQLAPPARLMDWLQAACAATAPLQIDPQAEGAGDSLARISCIGGGLTNNTHFAPYSRELRARPQLQRSLARVLLASLQAQAAAAQLPPNCRPALFWQAIEYSLIGLRAPQMTLGLSSLLGQPAGDGTSHASRSTVRSAGAASSSDDAALQLLLAIGPLLAAASHGRPACLQPVECIVMIFSGVSLLGDACSAWHKAQPARSQQQLSQVAGALALFAQRLPDLLRVLQLELRAEPELSSFPFLVLQQCASITAVLCDSAASTGALPCVDFLLGVGQEQLSPACSDALLWCDAAGALLRALPVACSLASEARQHRPDRHSAADCEAATSKLAYAAVVTAAVLVSKCGLNGATAAVRGSADPAAAFEAAWGLHSRFARCFHWIAAGAGAPSMAAHPDVRATLLPTLSSCLAAATSLAGQVAQRQGADAEETVAPIRRSLHALEAAHLEAATAMLADRPIVAGLGWSALAGFLQELLGIVARGTPAGLLTNQPLQRCLECLLAAIQELAAQAEDCPASAAWPATLLLDTPTSSPFVDAWLVEHRVLDAALSWLAKAASHHQEFLPQTAAVIAALLDRLGLPPQPQLQAAAAGSADSPPIDASSVLSLQQQLGPAARERAAAIIQQHATAEQVEQARLALARIAAARSCANLRCPNLALEGGPAAGQGVGCKRCGGCRVAWYCGTACSRADWKAGHRHVCKLLAAERQEGRQAVGAAGEEREG